MTTTLELPRDLQGQLFDHPIYGSVNDLPRLRVFMETHCFAVWDFMSLVKRLQADLCPSSYPWVPPSDTAAARFINEIVLGEESDLDLDGQPAGHLDIYLRAMDEVGADVSGFRSFLSMLRLGRPYDECLNGIRARKPVRDFVSTTMDIVMNGSTVEVAAAFLYGREDPIPRMFQSLLGELQEQGLEAPRFAYYLERHIELDGDHHGPMGEQLLSRLIDGDPERQRLALHAATRAVRARVDLWTGLHAEVEAVDGLPYRQVMGI